MTHDPMCPQYDCWLEGCTVCDECALIARVREDERSKFVSVDTTYMPIEQYDAMMKALGGGTDD